MNDFTHVLALFFTGALFANCVPHLCAGMMGVPFPSPFATPRGVGNSSPVVNVLWGGFNLAVALLLLGHHPVTLGLNVDCAILAAGALMLGVFCARHFGKVRGA